MRRCIATLTVAGTMLLACQDSPIPTSPATPVAATPALHAAVNPPCTTSFTGLGTFPFHDWDDAANWTNGVPGPTSSVCILFKNGGNTAILSRPGGPATVTIAALTIGTDSTLLSTLQLGSTVTLQVTGDIVIHPGNGLGLDRDAASAALVIAQQLLNLGGLGVSTGLAVCPCPDPIIRADVDHRGTLTQTIVFDKPGLQFANNGGATSGPTGLGLMLVPASTGNPAVTVNGGSLTLRQQAGSLTLNTGDLNAVLEGADLVLNGPTSSSSQVTIRPPAGGSSSLTGDLIRPIGAGGCNFIVNVEGAPGGTSILALVGNVTNSACLNLTAGTGGVLRVTGGGLFTNAFSLQTVADPTGAVEIAVDVQNTGGIGSSGPLRLTRTNGSFDNAGSVNTGGVDTVLVTNGVTWTERSGSVQGGTLELRGAHLVDEAPDNMTTVRNLQGSTVAFGAAPVSHAFAVYQQDGASTLTLRIGGAISGAGSDRLDATDLALDGTLELVPVGSFTPGVCGQMLDILRVGNGSFASAFATANGLVPAPNRAWHLVYQSNAVTLSGHDPTRTLTLEPNPAAASEGELSLSHSYQVCLGREPTADVTVAVTPDAQLERFPSSLVFQTASWWVARSGAFNAFDDAVHEGPHTGTLQHLAASADPFFSGASSTLTVNITDNDNLAPVAVSDAAATVSPAAVTIAVLSNDSDGDGDALTVSAVTQPPNGVVLINPGAVTLQYTPNAGFTGVDQFSYTASDGFGGTATASVSVTVNAANSADLSISATTQVTGPPSRTVTYRITERNNGPSPSPADTVKALPTTGLTFMSVTGGSCTNVSGTMRCVRPSLAAGASRSTLVLKYRTTRAATFTKTITISGKRPDSNSTNNATTVTATVP